MSVIKCEAYIDNDAVFKVNSFRIGLVQSAKETVIKQLCVLQGIGETEGTATYRLSKSYEIELVRISSSDEIDFAALDNAFNLTAQKSFGTVVYGSCRVKKLETKRISGDKTLETVTLTAKSRSLA